MQASDQSGKPFRPREIFDVFDEYVKRSYTDSKNFPNIFDQRNARAFAEKI